MTENQVKTFIPLSQLGGKTFIVEDYQRGYKWGSTEIKQLLNDVEKHDTTKGPYCLQPIIVKPLPEKTNTFEIIDGQQRLTSLYLLLANLDGSKTLRYNICYKTRSESEAFLKDESAIALIEQAETWPAFKNNHPAYDNVDIYHFFDVYKSINRWFLQRERGIFLEKLKAVLYVIWYDVTAGSLSTSKTTSAENIFINFNANKVDLGSSELIKALFILDHEGKLTKEQKKHKAIELALEWDAIENTLQNESFWYFICNDSKYDQSQTRIDYLFDIQSKKVKNRDKLAAYHYYENLITNEEVRQDEWRKIKTLFYKLDEWYHDKHLYHYVGYLIATELADITTIIEESKGKTKESFRESIEARIKHEFKKKNTDNKPVYQLEALSFDENKKACNNLLLLLNVTYYLKDASQNKFPFNLYHKYSWSIEHINPQNPREFSDKAQLIDWLTSVESFFEKDSTIVMDLQAKISEHNSIAPLLKDKRFNEALERAMDSIDVHSIANLALLDRNTNSALGNKPYLEKRGVLLRFDRNGCNDSGQEVFVPICTRDLFTKTYSYLKSDSPQRYFGAKDMQDYLDYMKDELKNFLPS